jgi:hypothetical protein
VRPGTQLNPAFYGLEITEGVDDMERPIPDNHIRVAQGVRPPRPVGSLQLIGLRTDCRPLLYHSAPVPRHELPPDCAAPSCRPPTASCSDLRANPRAQLTRLLPSCACLPSVRTTATTSGSAGWLCLLPLPAHGAHGAAGENAAAACLPSLLHGPPRPEDSGLLEPLGACSSSGSVLTAAPCSTTLSLSRALASRQTAPLRLEECR